MQNSTSTDEILTKETSENENTEIGIAKNERNESFVVPKKSDDEDAHSFHAETTEIVPNGDLKNDSCVQHDDYYDDLELDSEEYEIEGTSGDEYKSHDSQEENRENGDGEENQVNLPACKYWISRV